MADLQVLSELFLAKYNEISHVFGGYQKSKNVTCPQDCGHCCLRHDVNCTPYEFLPMAFHLLKENLAEHYLTKAQENIHKTCCVFLNAIDEEKGLGRCSQYAYRPFICRAFGVSARRGKHEKIEYSVCALLKKDFDLLADIGDVPLIEEWRKQFENLDPHLFQAEMPINKALVIALDKVLLWNSYRPKL